MPTCMDLPAQFNSMKTATCSLHHGKLGGEREGEGTVMRGCRRDWEKRSDDGDEEAGG